jgi:hypothetical protein
VTTSNQKTTSPANRLGIDYRRSWNRKVSLPIIDAHTHVRSSEDAPLFFQAADHFGIREVVSMTAIETVPELLDRYADRLRFIAVPRFRNMAEADPLEFRADWIAGLDTFWNDFNARYCKFWMAPRMRQMRGLTLEHEYLRPVIDHALQCGYEFMTHVGDPSCWFAPGKPYADTEVFGTKLQQFDQLEWFLDYVAPRRVIGAHLGGFSEDPEFLESMLSRHENYYLDTSATKWIVREVSPRAHAFHDLMTKYADRIIFGSDLVTGDGYDFDHYASRYWTHLHLWESDYRGESPIEDPDAEPPLLNGVDLPADVLEKVYRRNAEQLGIFSTTE